MTKRLLLCSALSFITAMMAAVSPTAQTARVPPSTLTIAGDVGHPISFAPDELKAIPRTKVQVTSDGRTITYEGVLVAEVLKRAGVPLGRELRGSAVASY